MGHFDKEMTRDKWDEIVKHGPYSQELNWFATDNSGQLAVFTSVMNAPIPDNVKNSYERYLELKSKIDSLSKTTQAIITTKEKGNLKDWIEYADKGLFAFDFQDVHRTKKKNQFDLIARPKTPLTLDKLDISDSLTDTIVKIDCDFHTGDLNTEKIR